MRKQKKTKAEQPLPELTFSYWHEEVVKIDIEMLKPYPDHPFKPLPQAKLEALAESIRQNGLQQPIIVRDTEDMDGQFEYTILSGHNRVEAIRLLGEQDVPSIIRQMDDDAAALTVVQTNLDQREDLLPSERAFAYRLIMDTYKNRVQASDANSSSDLSTGWTGDSSMAYYYIRLTELIPELLDLVDDGKVPVKGGVELSYVDQGAQQAVLDYLEQTGKKLSVKNATLIRSAYEARRPVTADTIPNILSKPQKKVKGVSISNKILRRYAIPDDVDLTAVICGLLEDRFGKR